MRLGTYNVLGLRGYPHEVSERQIGGPGDPRNEAHFAGVFAELDCDILALQEGVAVNHAQRIARRLKYYLATFPSPISWPGHLFSRCPILESRTFSHTPAEDVVPPFSRTAGAALLQVDVQTRIWVVVVHLHPGETAMRDREADILRARLEDLAEVDDRIAVVGDYNCEVDERLHEHLAGMGYANAMQATGDGLQLTMDTVGIRPHCIDHIYLSPALKGSLAGAEVVRRPGFRSDDTRGDDIWVHSDHLPVLADLQL